MGRKACKHTRFLMLRLQGHIRVASANSEANTHLINEIKGSRFETCNTLFQAFKKLYLFLGFQNSGNGVA